MGVWWGAPVALLELDTNMYNNHKPDGAHAQLIELALSATGRG